METASSLTFQDFLDRMRNPASTDLVRSIKSFIVSFSFSGPDPENDGKKVQEFFTNMETAIANHPLWLAATDQEIDSAMEALEKYVMTKLFPRTFALSQEDTNLDLKISHKIHLLQTFFHPRHLDIPPILVDQQSLVLAEKELSKINSFKAPSEKLRCIVNCCKIINNVLLGAMSENNSLAGADSFLPLLINVTIQANPPQLHSNLRYIELYRRKTKLVSEDAYYFTNLVSSKTFITDLSAKSLSMDENVFEESMKAARQTRDFTAEEHLVSSTTTAPDHKPFGPMPGIRNSNADGINFPYMEAEARDLTVKDVEVLLSVYKDVVAKYSRLSEAIKSNSFTKSLEIRSTTTPTVILPRKEEEAGLKAGESGGE